MALYKTFNESESKVLEEMASAAMMEVGSFVKRRKRILGRVDKLHKDFRKKQNAKRSWRNNRNRYMKGIKRFHRSTKGKTFHRKLNRFLSQRAPLYREGFNPIDDLIAVYVLQSHLVMESGYVIPDFDEHLSSYSMIQHAMEMMPGILKKMNNELVLEEDEICMLSDLCDRTYKD